MLSGHCAALPAAVPKSSVKDTFRELSKSFFTRQNTEYSLKIFLLTTDHFYPFMKYHFPYGADSVLKLDVSDDSSHFFLRRTRKSVPGEGIRGLISRRLSAPRGYPPLGACLMPGDHVVIPLAPGVPRAEEILAGILEYLFSPEESSEDTFTGRVTILRPPGDAGRTGVSDEEMLRRILEKTPETPRECVALRTHAPAEKKHLALLGVSAEDEPLVVSRDLFDADFILPVGVFTPREKPGDDGFSGAIYPAFSDENTQKRFREGSRAARRKETREKLAAETREITRLLGILPAVWVLPNIPRGHSGEKDETGVADVLAGAYEEIFRKGYSRYRRMWRPEDRPLAEIVVASITGGTESQTWENVAAALRNAAHFAEEEAMIFLASDISSPLGPAMRTYRRLQDPDMSLRKIRREDFPDAELARSIIPLLHRFRVYFISPLDEELLGDLNISRLEDLSDMRRLVARSEMCVFLPDAHRVVF